MVSLKEPNGSSRLTTTNMLFIYPALSWGFRLVNCCGGSLRKTHKFHTFLQVPRVFWEKICIWFSFLGEKMRALSAAAEPRGPFNKPDLILTVVNGQKPRCVRVATVADLSQTSGALSTLEPWQSRPVHIKVVVWPCIPDEVWINELWTSNSRITTHKSSSPARRNLQRTKMLEKKKNQRRPCLNIVTRNVEQREQQRGYFKSLQLSDVWESTMKWAACQTASFTTQIKTFDRTCLPSRALHTTNCSCEAAANASHIQL